MISAQLSVFTEERHSGICLEQISEKSLPAKGKIWIDLDNSPHVPFFAPIIEELEHRGYSMLLTARDCFQVCELADRLNLKCEVVGRHYGKSKVLKLSGVFIRALQMVPIVRREKPDVAVSHGSRAQLLCSALTSTPCITIFDYEFARGPAYLHANSWAMIPDVIPDDAVHMRPDRVVKYPGIKEDVYVPKFVPDSSLRRTLGVEEGDLLVTLRPPANEAHYHNHQSDELFHAVVDHMSKQPNLKMVLLPRNHKQEEAVRQIWPELFSAGKIIIPEHALDGLNLIWHSDLVVGGGGTMNREAAALQVPVYSVFRGKTGAVDRYLADNGRMVLLETLDDVKKIILRRRDGRYRPHDNTSPALKTIVNQVVRVAESKRWQSAGVKSASAAQQSN